MRGKGCDRLVGVVECEDVAYFSRVLVSVEGAQTPFETPVLWRDEAQLLGELLEIPVVFVTRQACRDRAAAQLRMEGAVTANIRRVASGRARPWRSRDDGDRARFPVRRRRVRVDVL